MEQEDIKQEDITKEVDFGSLFENAELSEETQAKVKLIFEVALEARLTEEVKTIQEEFEVKFEETLEEVKAELVEKIDSFLDYAVEEWVDQNRIALESGIRNEITENFIPGLKELFTENYIEVPEEKFDLLGEMETKVVDLTTDLDEQLAKNVTLNSKINSLIKEAIVVEVGTGLTAIDSDKFKGLVENVDFESESIFKDKVTTIRENYFSKTTPKAALQESAGEEKEVVKHAGVSAYVAAWKK